jgi:Lrp/AsnC family transcriptional regulator, leucine-responsive regulatory protein
LYQLDGIDRQILRLLQKDGRMTNAALAEALDLTPTPTLQRVRKLEDAGVIRGHATIVDRALVGQPIMVWVQVSLQEHRLAIHTRFVDAVMAFPEVLEVHHVAGEEDFVLKVVVADIAQYEDWLLHTLTEVPGIDRVKSTFVLSTRKAETAIPIPEVTS